MTNAEKYKTVKERLDAFCRFCSDYPQCEGCPLDNTERGLLRRNYLACTFMWLEMGEPDEKSPLPCPYCGGVAIMICGLIGVNIRCLNCGIQTPLEPTKDAAIARWNSRVSQT